MLFLFLFLLVGVGAQSSQCPADKTPKQLAAVSVWMQDPRNGSLRFKISDEDLLDQGFSRSPYDRDSAIIMMAEYPGFCSVGECLMKLTSNRRVSDGSLIQQENVFGPPSGFVSMGDELFCARKQGNCGAEMPIYRFTKGRPNDMVIGYSIDPMASIPGYWRDVKPICYGWSDGGSIVTSHADSGDCVRVQEIKNGKTRYSYPGSGAYFPVGTTASVDCNHGYAAGGASTILCTKNGWYPSTGLGYCVKQNVSSRIPSVGLLSSGSASQMCSLPAKIENAQIVYTQLEQNGRYPTGTTATVICALGYTVSSASHVECQDGKWSRHQWPKCIQSEKVKCQPMLEGGNGQIIYNSSADPLTVGSLASLSCDLGFVPVGTVKTECTENGWKPPSLGQCQVQEPKRSRRQLSSSTLPCTAIAPLGGTPSYVQSNPTVPYSAGTSVLLICNTGYTLSGSGSAICLNGLWSPPMGSCSPSGFGVTPLPGNLNAGSSGANCLDFVQPPTGKITYTTISLIFGTHPSGTIASLICNVGTTVSGSLSTTCQNGIWSPVALGTCTATNLQNSLLECTNPVVANAQITYSQSTATEAQKPIGTVATVACNIGYILQGIGSLTCQSSGLWSPLPPTCAASGLGGIVPSLQCPIMATPVSGTIAYSTATNPMGPFNAGTVATLTCNSGTFPSGPLSASCTSTGIWNPIFLGPCIGFLGGSLAGQCPTLGNGIGGTIRYSAGPSTGPFNTGTIATIFCDIGKILTGPASASCTGSVWSPSVVGPCTLSGLPGTGVVGIGGGLQCPAMIPPFNGIVNYSLLGGLGTYPSGTVATVTCTSGIITGTASASCLNGVWNPPTLGTCSLGGALGLNNPVATLAPGTGCPVISPPVGTSVNYSNGAIGGLFPSGTIASATCTTFGQPVIGAMSAACLGTNWSTVLGSCSSGASTTSTGSCVFGAAAAFGSTLSYSNNQQMGPFPSGTIATARCTTSSSSNTGSPASATCTNGFWNPSFITGCSGQADPPLTGGTTSGTCPTIPVPIGGSIIYSTPQFGTVPSGTTATLTCSTGSVSGSSFTTCTNGQWLPAIGTCGTGTPGTIGSQCTTPPQMPVGASALYSNGATIFGPWSEGTTATISCPLGQIAFGIPVVTCRSGSWGSTTVSCSAPGGTTLAPGVVNNGLGTCPVLIAPAFGTINYSQGGVLGPFPVGSQATLSCSPGFSVSGTQIASCINGQWTTQLGSCQAGGTGVTSAPGSTGTCTALPLPAFGTVTYSQGGLIGPFPTGTQATISCTIGFSVQGIQSSSCLNGQWSPQLGSCQAGGVLGTATTAGTGIGTCTAAVAPAFGTINYSQAGPLGPFPAGTTGTLSCSAGFSVQGTATSSCLSSQWSPPFGTCQAGGVTAAPGIGGSTCTTATAPAFGTINYSQSGPFGPFPAGTTATLTCSAGFSVQGTSTASCFSGQWNPPLGTCQAGGVTAAPGIGGTTCTTAIAPAFGTLTYSQSGPFGPFQPGTTVTLSCSIGFTVSGSTTSMCSAGQWNPPLGTCSSAGTLTTSNPLTANGQCLSSTSPVLYGATTYSNGQFLAPWPQGTTARLQCIPGFTMNGSSTLTCQNSQWSPASFGSCNPPSLPTSFTQCQAVPMIFGGTVQYSPLGPPYNEGATATLVCNAGTSASGLTSVTCRSGGWSPFPGLGSCVTSVQRSPTRSVVNPSLQNESCLTPRAPPFSEITFSNMSEHGLFPTGTEAVMKCTLGYISQGVTKAVCQNGSFRPLMGNCHNERGYQPPGTCMPLIAPMHGNVSYIQSSKEYSLEVGTIALLSCQNNYAVTGTATLHCTPSGWSPNDGFGQCDTMGNHIE